MIKAPEGDSHLALVDVGAPTADSAVALAWVVYMLRPQLAAQSHNLRARQGGIVRSTQLRVPTSPNEKRRVGVLFDSRGEADVASQAKSFYAQLAADRKLLKVSADSTALSNLARSYHNDALGDIDVRRDGGRTVFNCGEFRSEIASRRNPDGSISFLTFAPGIDGLEFVVDTGDGKQLTI